MTEQNYPVYAEITGPIVMIGFGSIGRGTLPLIGNPPVRDYPGFAPIQGVGGVATITPSCSRWRNRFDNTLGAKPSSPSSNSLNLRGPSSSELTKSSVHRSPTRATASSSAVAASGRACRGSGVIASS